MLLPDWQLRKDKQSTANASTRQTGRPHAGYLVPGVRFPDRSFDEYMELTIEK